MREDNEVLINRFGSGKFQGGGGWDKESCDICQNSSFYQDALQNMDSSRGFMLNLCDEHARRYAPARNEFKQKFEEEKVTSQITWIQRILNKVMNKEIPYE